jgi:glutaredoxin 3
MPNIEIYFKSWCSYSRRVFALLERKGVDYNAIDLTHDAYELEQQMRDRAGRTSVPQIFIDSQHIGGYDDIAALDSVGELDPLLFGEDVPYAA